MGNPPTMKMAVSHPRLPEVRIILPAYSSHRLLEASKLVPQVFKIMLKDVQLSRLPVHQFGQIVGLEKDLG